MISSIFGNRLAYTDSGIFLRVYSLSKLMAMFPKKFPRLFLKEIELGKLLMGGEIGFSSASYARATGDFLRPSRPIAESPHAQLLREYRAEGEDLFRPGRIEATAYYKNLAQCIDLYGGIFNMNNPKDIPKRARKFCYMLDGKEFDMHEVGESEKGSFVKIRRISSSDCYEILDGHHRLSVAAVKGLRKHKCLVLPLEPVLTPIQQMILDSHWTNGHRVIYQPIPMPELATWPVMRRCTDRFAMMEKYLAARGIRSGSYLDICCSYGWFVAEMKRRGFDAFGIDRDKAAILVGRLAYGLDESSNEIIDMDAFLDKQKKKYDIVSCFSVLHHFILGVMPGSAADFIRKVDAATGKILFFDTGECHEDWFKATLAGWTPEFIKKWLQEHTSFSRIEILGVEEKNPGLYENKYQRHLFACSRD